MSRDPSYVGSQFVIATSPDLPHMRLSSKVCYA